MTQRVFKDDARVLTAINDSSDFCNLTQRLAFLYPVYFSLWIMLYELGQEMAGATGIIQYLHLVGIRELRQRIDDKVVCLTNANCDEGKLLINDTRECIEG
jgi:hypothetical protein